MSLKPRLSVHWSSGEEQLLYLSLSRKMGTEASNWSVFILEEHIHKKNKTKLYGAQKLFAMYLEQDGSAVRSLQNICFHKAQLLTCRYVKARWRRAAFCATDSLLFVLLLFFFFPEHSIRFFSCMSKYIIDNASGFARAGLTETRSEPRDGGETCGEVRCVSPTGTPNPRGNSFPRAERHGLGLPLYLLSLQQLRATCSANNAFLLCHQRGTAL